MSASDFALGICVNIVSAVLVFVIVWGFLFVSKRRHLVDFFHARGRGITLYTSTLNVRSGGAVDAAGQPRTFAGPALPLGEARVIAAFEQLLSSYAFGKLAILRHVRFVDVDYRTESAPATTDLVERSRTLLTLGSPGYNTASEFVEAEFKPRGQFANDNGLIGCAHLIWPQLGG